MSKREFSRLCVALCVGLSLGILFTLWAAVSMNVGVFDGFQCKRYSPIDASCMLFERSP